MAIIINMAEPRRRPPPTPPREGLCTFALFEPVYFIRSFKSKKLTEAFPDLLTFINLNERWVNLLSLPGHLVLEQNQQQ
jgi:hypothetical protein